MKIVKYSLGLLIITSLTYFLGPKPKFDPICDASIAKINISLDSLDNYVNHKEGNVPHLKLGNQSRIVWVNDSMHQTDYAVVYLHGFSASPMESNPVHLDFARKYGMNIYLPLLAGHGIDDIESFRNLTPNDLIQSAKEAIAIGQLIGKEVIVMSCSTGSTLSIYLAASNPELIDVQIMYSPNLALNNPQAQLLTGPWGIQLVKAIAGDYFGSKKEIDPESKKYWTTTYRSEGLIALQKLIDETMTEEVLTSISQPLFIGYYYKNEEEKDQTISTDAIVSFYENVDIPDSLKSMVTFPDAGEHVIANPIKSNQVEDVAIATNLFAEKVLGLVAK